MRTSLHPDPLALITMFYKYHSDLLIIARCLLLLTFLIATISLIQYVADHGWQPVHNTLWHAEVLILKSLPFC